VFSDHFDEDDKEATKELDVLPPPFDYASCISHRPPFSFSHVNHFTFFLRGSFVYPKSSKAYRIG
jgi:hypothetical protein